MNKAISSASRTLPAIAAGLAFCALPMSAVAQQVAFPTHQITMIYPYAPGGGGDALFRLICQEAGNRLGQTIVIDPRPGANGRLGLLAQRNAKGDAHLLSYGGTNVIAIDPLRDPEFRIQPLRDYTPITTVYGGPYLVVVSPTVPYRDMKGLIAQARATPGKVVHGMASFGSISQIAMETLAAQEGISFLSVSYKGEAPVWQALMAGEAHIAFLSAGTIPQIQAGKLIGIATTSAQRLPQLPNIPTTAEAGYPVLNSFTFSAGVFAPGEISADATGKLYNAFAAALKVPDISRRSADLGFSPGGISPEQWLNDIRALITQITPVVAKMKFE